MKPFKIVVTGGKGGTGKSTFSVLKARELLKKKKKVILCDCDVECPNDYLLIGEKLGKQKKYIFSYYPKLIKDKCNKCGLCVKACKSNAVFKPPEKTPVFVKELCSSCGACWIVCPNKAIKPKKEKVGQIFVSRPKKNLWLVTGLAKKAVEETGPIVMKTKEFALDLAKKKKADVVLFDTAPGIHCPVVAALLDCDIIYAITEPTPMGAHDLNLALELLKKMNLQFKVVLNQSDLGDKSRVEKVVKKFGKKIEKEIPHSKEILEFYSKGQLLDIKYNF